MQGLMIGRHVAGATATPPIPPAPDRRPDKRSRTGTSMVPRTHTAVTWLLNGGEPAIRLMTRHDVLGGRAGKDAGQVLAAPR